MHIIDIQFAPFKLKMKYPHITDLETEIYQRVVQAQLFQSSKSVKHSITQGTHHVE